MFIQPRVRKRMQGSSIYKWKDIKLFLPPGVFHPGYFHSTHYLLQHALRQELPNTKVLELGAGNGLISIALAKRGALVTSSDINKTALAALNDNARANGVSVETIYSDLFGALTGRSFDLIVINPPFYPQDARNDLERAWFAGIDYAYFSRLFAGLFLFMQKDTQVCMVLSEDCSTAHIEDLAQIAGLTMEVVEKKRILWEWNYIYHIKLS